MYGLLLLIWLAVFGLNQSEKDSFKFPELLGKLRHEKNINEPIQVYSSNFEHPIRYYLLKDSLEGFQSSFIKNVSSLEPNSLLIINTNQQTQTLVQPFEQLDAIGNYSLVRIKTN